jgi:hypothetical protein
VIGISALADGAAQVFARAVTDLGGTLVAYTARLHAVVLTRFSFRF